jgi:hypothetical protein
MGWDSPLSGLKNKMKLDESRLATLAEWFFNPEAPIPPGLAGNKTEIALQCFEQLFLWAPVISLNAHAISQFDRLAASQFQSVPAAIINYTLPHPKYFFLKYLLGKGYLLQGTKSSSIDILEPEEQIDWTRNSIRAVFAARDVFWPMHFALLNRSALTGSLRNGCVLVERLPFQEERFYFFSVSQQNLVSDTWSDGFIYILPGASFHPTTTGQIRFDEWASEQAVPVIAKLPVSPTDFPFLYQVSRHEESESIFTTWLRYKERLNAA